MRFGQSFLEQLNPTTAKLLHRADYMIETNAEETARTNALLKVTDYAYANQEWLAYVSAIYYAMWSMNCCDNKYIKQMLQYSNDFIRFGKEHFEDAIAGTGRFSDWFIRAYVNNYHYIYEFYHDFYQVSDEKIEELFELYYQNMRRYPSTNTEYHYMFARMHRSTLLGDKKLAATYLHRVEALTRSSNSCYVCNNRDIVGAMLLTGRLDEALHRISQIVSDEGIPESWYDEYRNCENAVASVQYHNLITYAFWLRMPDVVLQLAQDFGQEVLAASSSDRDNFAFDTKLLVLSVTHAADTLRTEMLKELSDEFDTMHELVPIDQLKFFLCAWSYIEMLRQNGVDTVVLTPLKPPIEAPNNLYDTQALATYLLKKADALGAKFDASRPSFQYRTLRQFWISMLESY